MNSESQSRDAIRQVVADILEMDSVPGDASPATTTGWDSVNHLSIVASLEVTLGLTFTPDEIVEMIEGIDAVVMVVERKQSADE